MSRLILASSSPRRRELLSDAGYCFEVIAPRPEAEDEAPMLDDPVALVADLARRKGADALEQVTATGSEPAWLLSADTVAECQGAIFGKPVDRADARRILLLLSGQCHRVLSGVCLWHSATPAVPVETRVVETTLEMDVLTDAWLDDYLVSDAWRGKAGAFGFQDDLGVVRIIEGSESNVVGLPMTETGQMLVEHAALYPSLGKS